MSTKDFSTKDEIIITLKGGRRAAVDPSARKSGGFIPGITDDTLPRRRKKKGGINFYDLGQFLVGEVYETYDGILQSVLSHAEGLDTIQTDYPPDHFSTFLSDMNTAIFAVTPEDRKSTFYRIFKGDLEFERNFEIEFGEYSDELQNLPDSVWTENGLVVPGSELPNLIIKPHAVLFNTDIIDFSTAEIKDGDTDETVSGFVLDKNADIYLMPELIDNTVFAFYKDGLVDTGIFSDLVQVNELANHQLQILPRNFIGDYNNVLNQLTFEAFNWYLALLIRQLPNNRGRKLTVTPSGSGYAYNFETISASVIPNATYFDENGNIIVDAHHFGDTLLCNFAFVSFFLEPTKALIFQNNHWFYVWKPA